MIKKLFFLLLTFIFLIFLALFNLKTIEENLPTSVKKLVPWSIVNYYHNIKNVTNAFKNYNYLYNSLFLPESHFRNFKLIKSKLINNEKVINDKKIFIDLYKKRIILTTNTGEFYFNELNKILDNKIELNTLKNNLSLVNFEILDTLVYNEDLYVSLKNKVKKSNNFEICEKFMIMKSKVDFNHLRFEIIFEDKQCAKSMINGGRMQVLKEENTELLLFSLSDVSNDMINDDPQINSNFFGKINFIDLKDKKIGIYSKGHRNPQGLHVFKEKIFSTEHGPRGGDEINLIKRNNNYGWPNSSYGKPYFDNKITYKKNHNKYSYTEPIFTFIKAIGISEIISIPSDFLMDDDLENLFLISSLFGRSIYLVKLNQKMDSVVFVEKIFINQRIRDIKYYNEENFVILSLENPTRLAILK